MNLNLNLKAVEPNDTLRSYLYVDCPACNGHGYFRAGGPHTVNCDECDNDGQVLAADPRQQELRL